MKLRHAAALTLVGWYLMVPPGASDGRLDLQAPISRWEIESSYDTADDCQGVIDGMVRLYPTLKEEGVGLTKAQALLTLNGKCIATDDPRLVK
jgi:hypothetical protein